VIEVVRADPVQRDHRYGDRCPYSRRFTPAFADNPDCPAYQPATFTVTDMGHSAVGIAITCRHLATGTAEGGGRFYPRCGLGDAQSRLLWLATTTVPSVAVMRALEEEFEREIAADRTRLVEAKARLLSAGDEDAALLHDLELMLSGLLDRVDAFITARAERVRDVGLDPGGLRELLHDWSLAWLRSRSLFSPAVEDMRLHAFTRESAALLGADARPSVATAAPAEVVERAGALVIERSRADGALRLVGDVDITSADAVTRAVVVQAGDAAEVVVDFSQVLFCDLSGLRALVRAAAELGPGQLIVVRGMPSHLHNAARLVGWADLPGLAIAHAGD
jgi:anti-anti-sigma regulatory factor